MESNKEATVGALLSLLQAPIPPTALTACVDRDVDLDAIIAGVKPKVARHLRDTATQLGLSKQVADEVLFSFVHLVALEEVGKHTIKTDKDRRADLERIAELCASLSATLRSLDLRETIGLNLFERKALWPWADPESPRKHVMAGFGNIDALEKAARWLCEQIPKGKGGRRPLLRPYAIEIARLWAAVEPSGLLKLGRGGEFEYLCNELFKAARVPAQAEGAIRYFKRHLLSKAAHEIPVIADLLVQANGQPTSPSLNRRKNPYDK